MADEGLVEAPDLVKHGPTTEVRPGKIRRNGQGPIMAGEGFMDAPQPKLSIARIVMSLGVVGGDG